MKYSPISMILQSKVVYKMLCIFHILQSLIKQQAKRQGVLNMRWYCITVIIHSNNYIACSGYIYSGKGTIKQGKSVCHAIRI